MPEKFEMHICLGSSCFSRGNKEVVIFVREYLRKNHLEDRIIFKGSRCMGNCSKGPNLKIKDKIHEGISLTTIEVLLEKELSQFK